MCTSALNLFLCTVRLRRSWGTTRSTASSSDGPALQLSSLSGQQWTAVCGGVAKQQCLPHCIQAATTAIAAKAA